MRNHYKKIIQKAIDKMLNEDKDFIFNIREVFPELSPSDVCDFIEEDLGWTQDAYDSNGWECDTWCYFAKNNNPRIVLCFDGYYWNMVLRREDESE